MKRRDKRNNSGRKMGLRPSRRSTRYICMFLHNGSGAWSPWKPHPPHPETRLKAWAWNRCRAGSVIGCGDRMVLARRVRHTSTLAAGVSGSALLRRCLGGAIQCDQAGKLLAGFTSRTAGCAAGSVRVMETNVSWFGNRVTAGIWQSRSFSSFDTPRVWQI